MNTLEQLLVEWEAGTLTPAGVEALKQLLAAPAARKELVDDWLFYEAVYGALQAQSQPAATATHPAAAQPATIGWRTWLARLIPQLGWRWLTIGAAAAVVALIASLVFLPKPPAASFTAVQGRVLIERSGNATPATAGAFIYPRDLLRVSSDGHAVIAWKNENTLIKLGPGTEFQIRNRTGGKQLDLQRGRLIAAVMPQPRGRPLTVRTPQAEVEVKGTRFTLSVTAQTTRLEVIEGAVALRKAGQTTLGDQQEIMVTAGNFALAAPNTQLKKETLTGCAVRELVAFPAAPKLVAQSGAVVWSEPIASLGTRGWPLGIAPTATNRYEQRLRGYLTAPAAGDYAFWISSGAASELWLSTDDNPANRQKIAAAEPGGAARTLPGQTAPPEALAGRGQKSAPQQLIAGRRYYFEVIQRDANDSVLAGWARPDPSSRSLLEVIGGDVLSPWIESITAAPAAPIR